jgi:ABC-type multidrug transport system ATPase subunit
MASVQNLCTKAILLSNGKNIFEGMTNEVVDMYISGTKLTLRKEVVITDEHRRYKVDDTLILKGIKITNVKPSVREDLNFQIKFDLQNTIIEEVCCTGSISSLDDARIGSFFSKSFFPHLGINVLEVVIPNHNLSPGSYYINISLSQGEIEKDNLRMLDHAYEVIAFEISQENKHSVFLTEWKSNWGKVFLKCQTRLIN